MSRVISRSVFVFLLVSFGVLGTSLAQAPPAKEAAKPAAGTGRAGHPRPVPPGGLTEESEGIESRTDSAWGRLTYPTGTLPPGDWRGKAMEHVAKYVSDGGPKGLATFPSRDPGAVVPPGTTWTPMGPTPLDSNGSSTGYRYGIVSGRVNALAFQPGSAAIAYAGFTDGGVWKTTNCCSSSTTWTALWDSPSFPVQSVGAITVDPTNINVIYVGTGDSQVPGHGDNFGNGVYKSTDGGTTWTQYGADVMSPYVSPGAPASTCCAVAPDENVKVIEIDPNNSDTIIAGCSFGLYISYNAGVTWTQYDIVSRTSPTFNDDAQRVTGLLVDGSTNPSTMYVAVGYPYESTRRLGLRGGANGVYKGLVPSSGAPALTLMNSGWLAGTGSGTPNDIGRIELAWNAAHTRIYAMVGNYGFTSANNIGLTYGIYTTSNGAANWTLLANSGEASFSNCGGDSAQDWYNLFLGVDPLNDTILYVGRVNVWKVTVNGTYTGTSSLASLSGVYSSVACGYGSIHPDEHAFAFQPTSNPTRFLAGNDGGVYFGTGAVGGFTQLNAGINTNQFYAGQIGRDFANTSGTQVQYLFGGMQDNGNASWTSANANLQWQARSIGGDGYFASFDPLASTLNAGRWYTEYSYGAVYCSTAGATGTFSPCSPAYAASEREDWSTPFLKDQWNCTTALCNHMVLGSTTVWASAAAAGTTWQKTANIDLTKNSGRYSQIISIDVAHSNPGSVLVGTGDGNVQWANNVFTGANCTAALANTATFSCTVNTATTWVNLTGANAVLPNRAIGGVAFAPNTNTTVYAAVAGFDDNTPATPGHIFRGVCSASPCTAGNITWTNKTGNLPDIPFEGITVNPNFPNEVFAGSWLGFYFTDDITANPPVWKRFQTGMPNTRITFLTFDRGVVATPRTPTTLAAFTFGRGVFATQVNLPNCAAPPPPASLTATPACDDVTLSWPASAGATGYNVLRGSSCGAVSQISWTSGLAFNDTTAIPGTTYFYAIQAVSGCGTSANSTCASAAILACPKIEFVSAGSLTQVCGDGDAVVEPGEQWSVTVTLVNSGTGPATNVRADLTLNGGSVVNAAITGNPASYGAMGVGATATASYGFTVESSANCVNDITFDVTSIVSNEGSYASEIPAFAVQVGQAVSEVRNQTTTPLIAQNNIVTTTLGAPFATPAVAATAGTVTWTLGGNTTLTACVAIRLRAPDATETTLKAAGTADTGSANVLATYQAKGPGQYTIVLEELTACGLVNRTASLTNTVMTVNSAQCDVASCGVTPGQITGETWSGTKDTWSWAADANSTGYRVYRGIQADLPSLLDSGVDSCKRWEGTALTTGPMTNPSDDPSAVVGRFYWFLTVGTNGAIEGPAGNATAGPRAINSSGVCP